MLTIDLSTTFPMIDFDRHVTSCLRMKTGTKRASTFWHRFVALLKNKTVVPEALKIERGINRVKFDSFENNIQRKRQVCWNYKDDVTTKD